MGRQAALRGSTAHPPPASPGLHLHTHSSHSGVCLVPGRCLKRQHEAEEGELQRKMQIHKNRVTFRAREGQLAARMVQREREGGRPSCVATQT